MIRASAVGFAGVLVGCGDNNTATVPVPSSAPVYAMPLPDGRLQPDAESHQAPVAPIAGSAAVDNRAKPAVKPQSSATVDPMARPVGGLLPDAESHQGAAAPIAGSATDDARAKRAVEPPEDSDTEEDVDDVDDVAGPTTVAVHASVRRPKWEVSPVSARPISTTGFKTRQAETLSRLRVNAARRNWEGIHSDHYDWWQFPIDDGRFPEYFVNSEADVLTLKGDAEWLAGYRESIRIVARAFGWDVDRAELTTGNDGGDWRSNHHGNRDVRLSKMIRSTWLFEMADYFTSLQAFARYANTEWNAGRGFHYAGHCLDEILYMQLPRRIVP